MAACSTASHAPEISGNSGREFNGGAVPMTRHRVVAEGARRIALFNDGNFEQRRRGASTSAGSCSRRRTDPHRPARAEPDRVALAAALNLERRLAAIDEFTGAALRLEGGVLLMRPRSSTTAAPCRSGSSPRARGALALQRRKPEPRRRRLQLRQARAARSHDPHPARAEPDRVCGGGDGGRHLPRGLPEDRGHRRRLRLRRGRWRNPGRA